MFFGRRRSRDRQPAPAFLSGPPPPFWHPRACPGRAPWNLNPKPPKPRAQTFGATEEDLERLRIKNLYEAELDLEGMVGAEGADEAEEEAGDAELEAQAKEGRRRRGEAEPPAGDAAGGGGGGPK